MNILMVCLGNICRSPMAEGILRHKASDLFHIDSAGTASFHIGESPDERAISVMKSHGIDIAQQKARVIQVEDFDNFDYIFAMDQSNYEKLQSLAKNIHQKEKIHLLLDYVGEMGDVPDPYYVGVHAFKSVYYLLDAATDKLLEKINLSSR